ncbi:MAG: hypothetical protein WCK65_11790 [Rhodospirillaceae bacterium]
MATIDQLNNVIGCDESAANVRLGEFASSVYQHFQYEERIMEMAMYPLRDIHTNEHNRLMEAVVGATKSRINPRQPITRISENLRTIFGVHADFYDKVFVEYLKKKFSC